MSSSAERSIDDGTSSYGYLKILIPAFAVGGIIGPKGKTIANIQVENRVKIQISKMNDYYPGTTERVCLVSGPKDNIMEVLKFCIKVINEKPHLDYAPLIDFDHKVTYPRRHQVKILIPNKTASKVIGNRGKTIREIKMKSGAFVQISQITDDVVIYERCITVMGEMQNNLSACDQILDLIIGDKHMESCLHISYSNSNHCAPNSNPIGSPIAEDWKAQTGPKILEDHTEINFTVPSVKVSLGTIAKNMLQTSPHKSEPISSEVKPPSSKLGKADLPSSTNTPNIPSSNLSFVNTVGPASNNLPSVNYPPAGIQAPISVPQFLDNLKVILRYSFYPPEILNKINHALTILANHGVLELFIRLLIDYNRNYITMYRNSELERQFIDSSSLYQAPPPTLNSENVFVPNQEIFTSQRMDNLDQSMFASVWHPTDFEPDTTFYPTASTPTWANQDAFSDKSDIIKPLGRHISNSAESSRNMNFDEFPPLSSGVFTPGSKML